MALIETRQLGRSYGARRGISNVDLTIQEGQIFGFLGPNGAGKTTTIRILLGFLRPDEGSASMLGRDCWRDSPVIKRHVGYVPGDVRLYPWLTARRGLRIIGKIREQDLLKPGLDLCDRFSLEPDLAVRKMSRGNRQKVALVLALVHQPRVIVLDEPTSGLDPLMQLTLMRLLQEMAQQGSTILFSSHTLSEVEQVCNHVAMIKGGRIVIDETLTALKLKAPRTVQVITLPEVRADLVRWPKDVQVVSVQGCRAELQLIGSAMQFLKWAAAEPLHDVSIGLPSLETLFRSYYDADL
jgi:ABC-2 type transport system ATP-binding protein